MRLFELLKISTSDVRILWASIFLRMLGYGLTNQVLTLYLKSISIPESRIGIFMTLTLIGDTVISYILTWYSDRLGRRFVMILGSAMIVISGFIFWRYRNFYLLLIAATFGVISPSGDETGPFKTIEEACMAHLSSITHRTEIFVFHGLFATVGAASGSILAGYVINYLVTKCSWNMVDSYSSIFILYSFIGLLKLILMLCLSKECEVVDKEPNVNDIDSSENAPLLSNHKRLPPNERETSKAELFGLSALSRFYLPRLLFVFMLDSLGYGFMPSAWIVYYFKNTFLLSAKTLGTLFFCTNLLSSMSSIPSGILTNYFGPVHATLATQFPSALFFSLIGTTSNVGIAAACLLFYNFTSSMDVVGRQVMLTSIMPKHELTKVMGVVNLGKTVARSIGPVFTGRLAESEKLYISYFINGLCLFLANTFLGVEFINIDGNILEKQRG